MKKLPQIAFIILAVLAGFLWLVRPATIKADTEVPKVAFLRVTAYSSSIDETDSSPFYTANGTHVRDGVVATNILPFGTKVEIPSLFGDKIFTVEDRMAKRYQNTIDIWMPSKGKALRFGVNYANVLIVSIPGAAGGDIAESK